jgi:HD-GYP domain-containing protein (c-di-GMP phosphodiesterase class II)
MARFLPLQQPILQAGQPLSRRLALIHGRILALDASISRIAFALYQSHNDLLSTYISHTSTGAALSFYDRRLATIPSLLALRHGRRCRVIDDLPQELAPATPHSRWLLEQGWRSSYTLPLMQDDRLLGFLFLNALRPAVFSAGLLEQLEPHLELLEALIQAELAAIDSLRASVQLALRMTGLRDPETGAHVERVSLYSRLIAMELGRRRDLPSDFAEDLYLFAALHDVGKVAIPDRILLKPGPLDGEERTTMNSHVQRGIDLVEQLITGLHLVADPKMDLLRAVVAGHHEKLDGSGYPFALQAGEIPLAARIVAVADIYDALSQARSYKPALPEAEVERILRAMAGDGKIDPDCVDVLLRSGEQRQAIAAAYRD